MKELEKDGKDDSVREAPVGGEVAKKRAYRKPSFEHERVFETMALACGKVLGNTRAMQIQPENLVNQAQKKYPQRKCGRQLQVELAPETLQRFGELRFMARGGSMLPAIYPGDWLTIKRDMGRTIRCGEVVLCLRNGALLSPGGRHC